ATLTGSGLDEDSVQSVNIDRKRHNHCLILGDAQKGKTNMLKLMIDQMQTKAKATIGLFDSVNHSLADYADDDEIIYMETKEHIEKWIQIVEQEYAQREKNDR